MRVTPIPPATEADRMTLKRVVSLVFVVTLVVVVFLALGAPGIGGQVWAEPAPLTSMGAQ
jgi:hypothetical protein